MWRGGCSRLSSVGVAVKIAAVRRDRRIRMTDVVMMLVVMSLVVVRMVVVGIVMMMMVVMVHWAHQASKMMMACWVGIFFPSNLLSRLRFRSL